MGQKFDLGDLVVKLVMDDKQFDAGRKKTETGLRDLDREAKQRAASVRKAVFGIGAAFATVAGAAAVLKKITSEMDNIGKAAQKIGIPVEQLSGLKYAAELADVSFETLSGSVQRLNRNLAEMAAGGQSQTSQAFQAIGVSVTAANGQLRSTEDILLDVADKFASYEDGVNKSALAMALFGKSGGELIPLLNQGSRGIKASADEAAKFGLIVDKEAADAADKFNDELDKLTQRAQGLGYRLASVVVPALNTMIDSLNEAIARGTVMSNTSPFGTGAGRGAVEGVLAAAQAAQDYANAANAVGSAAHQAAAKVEALNAAMAKPLTAAPGIPDPAQQEASLQRMIDLRKQMMGDTVNDPSVDMATKLATLDKALANTTIGYYEYGQAVKQVNQENLNHVTNLASATADALTTIFKENKMASIAAAVINTAVGITEAMKLPFPFNIAQAGLVAATASPSSPRSAARISRAAGRPPRRRVAAAPQPRDRARLRHRVAAAVTAAARSARYTSPASVLVTSSAATWFRT